MVMPYVPRSPSAYECVLINDAETTMRKDIREIAQNYSGDFQVLYFFDYLYVVTVFYKARGEFPSSFEELRAFMFYAM